MAMRRPAEAFPAGEILKEELEARGWSQADFAEIIGRPTNTISDIVAGNRGISPETARGLAAALGTTPEFWMNLDAAYQLSRVRDDGGDVIARRAKLYEKAPVKEMIRRGWIEPSDNIAVLENRLLKFFGVENIDDEPELPLHAARKSTPYGRPTTPAQKAWLFRACQLARAVGAETYSATRFDDTIDRLRPLLNAPQEIRHVPRALSDAGIRLVVVQPLPGIKIDGACFWLDAAPIVAVSLRFDRIDYFWFCLMHELGHVRQGPGSFSFDENLDPSSGDADRPDVERDANEFAVENLVPQQRLEDFIARVRPLYSARRIEAFAHTIGVHPAIVVGQLQYRGEIAYSSFRQTMAPARSWITASALTDGWGTTLPAQL
jgi:HTH-type transcriptional regulator/antitoxin HigA